MASYGNPDLYIKECTSFVGSMSTGIESMSDDCKVDLNTPYETFNNYSVGFSKKVCN